MKQKKAIQPTDTTPLILGGGFISSHLNGVRITRSNCDLRDATAVVEATEPHSKRPWIIAAAVSRLRDGSESCYDDNVAIATAIAQAARKHSPPHLIFLSTADLYGITPSLPITEITSLNPVTPYARGKMVAEQILNKLELPLLTLRLPGVFGPGDSGTSAIGAMQTAAIDNRIIIVNGDGSSLRDFVHVSDIARAVRHGLQNRIIGTYNIATGESHSIATIAKMIAQPLEKEICVEHTPQIQQKEPRPVSLIFDIQKFKKTFFQPRSLLKTLSLTQECSHTH